MTQEHKSSDLEPSLGRAVTAAMRFLEEFHNDVYLLIKQLDQLMSELGWQKAPDMGSRVTSGLGASLEAKHWMVMDISRFYVPVRAGAEGVRDIVLFSARLAPVSFDEPVCLVAVGKFDAAANAQGIWNKWTQTSPVLQYLATHDGLQTLPATMLDGFMSDARTVIAFVVPLVELRDDAALRTLIINPLEQAIGIANEHRQ